LQAGRKVPLMITHSDSGGPGAIQIRWKSPNQTGNTFEVIDSNNLVRPGGADCNANDVWDDMEPVGAGNAIRMTGGSDPQYVGIPNFSQIAPTDEITVSFWEYARETRNSWAFRLPTGAGNRISAHVPWGDGVVYWDFGNASG